MAMNLPPRAAGDAASAGAGEVAVQALTLAKETHDVRLPYAESPQPSSSARQFFPVWADRETSYAA